MAIVSAAADQQATGSGFTIGTTATQQSRATKMFTISIPGRKFMKGGIVQYENNGSQPKFYDYHLGFFAYSNNNPTENDYENCRTAVANGTLRYVTFNSEVGETGTPHLQTCAQAATPLTATAWQKALGGRVGNIVATKSPLDCIDYCQGYNVK